MTTKPRPFGAVGYSTIVVSDGPGFDPGLDLFNNIS